MGLVTIFSSLAQDPKSINLHLAEQNGLCLLSFEVDVGFSHLGQLLINLNT